jgi:hypothetical protein
MGKSSAADDLFLLIGAGGRVLNLDYAAQQNALLFDHLVGAQQERFGDR